MKIPAAAPITRARIGSGECYAMPLAAASSAAATNAPVDALDVSSPLDTQLTGLIYGNASEQQIRAHARRLAEDCFNGSVRKLDYLITEEAAEEIREDMATDGYPTRGINCDVATRTARDLFVAGHAEWVSMAAEDAFAHVYAWKNVHEARQQADYPSLRLSVKIFLADKAHEVLERHLRTCAERARRSSDSE